MKFDSFEELEPLYFGWFLNEKDSVSLLEEGQLWIEEAYKIPKFKDDFQYFTETTSAEGWLVVTIVITSQTLCLYNLFQYFITFEAVTFSFKMLMHSLYYLKI